MPADADAVKALFLEAAAIDDPSARAALVNERCREDATLLARVNALLVANDRAAANEGPTTDFRGKAEYVGEILDEKYKLVEKIGEGGMGSVYMAMQTEPVKRTVAVKVIKAGMDSKAVLARFEAERQALAMMDHPNIARVLDAGTTESGRPFFVMELVRGMPITEFCDGRKLTPRQRLELFVPVCQAIQHAHQKGVIHRDIKPSNVLIAMYDDRPVPKVIDFGVAKATGPALTDLSLMTGLGAVVGTPEYMSPEQANLNSLDIDTRSDVYSLGVLLYELLTGSTPVDRKSLGKAAILEVLRIVREVEAPRPSAKLSTMDALSSVAANRGTEPAKLSRLMKGELDWIVLKALEKDRSRRYDTANALSREIQRFLADEVIEARPPSTAYRVKKFVRRQKGQVIAASLVLCALVAGVVGTTAGLIRAAKANSELAKERDKVQARFELAVKAIETFHTGVSKDALLENPQFKDLRTKLLKEAARFYAELEKLLAGQTDAESRKTLAAGYYQLAELTDQIGDRSESLRIHRQALALRRELAATSGADVETRLDVARSLREVERMLFSTGDTADALRVAEEMQGIVAALEAESPTNAVWQPLAESYQQMGFLLGRMGKYEKGLEAHRKALATWHKLHDANPANLEFQRRLARSYERIGQLLVNMGKPAEARQMLRKALSISQKLFDNHPTVTQFQFGLALVYDSTGWTLLTMGKSAESLEASRKALAIYQDLVAVNPANTDFQTALANIHNNIGRAFAGMEMLTESLDASRKALAMWQKLVDVNVADINLKDGLADSYNLLGQVIARQKHFPEAFTALDASLAIFEKLVALDPTNLSYIKGLGNSHAYRGTARVHAGQPTEAAAELRRALELWTKLPYLRTDDQVERSRALALLAGLAGEAKSGVGADEGKFFSNQSVAALANAIKAGWALPSELREPDFDAVRGRADFQKLFAEVEAKAVQ